MLFPLTFTQVIARKRKYGLADGRTEDGRTYWHERDGRIAGHMNDALRETIIFRIYHVVGYKMMEPQELAWFVAMYTQREYTCRSVPLTP